MNLNIAICDDDTNDIAIMKKNILQYTIETDNNLVVSSYFSASDLLSDYKNHLYQIVLLDIEMPDINGMELARQLRDMDDDLLIVFTTSYPEYMHESFEVQPFQFFNTDSFSLEKGGFCPFFKLYNSFIGCSYTFYISVALETNFIPKYKHSVCLFHFSSLCIVYKYYELYIVLQCPRKRRTPLSDCRSKGTD